MSGYRISIIISMLCFASLDCSAEAKPEPFNESFSSDLILPIFDYNEADGVILACYYQGSSLLGNQRVQALAGLGSRSLLPTAYGRYSYLRFRCEFSLSVSSGYYYYEDGDDVIGEREEYYYESGVELVASYPIDRYDRVELGAGYAHRSKRWDDSGFEPYDRNSLRLAFNRDTAVHDGIKELRGAKLYVDIIPGYYDYQGANEGYFQANLDYRMYYRTPSLIVTDGLRTYDRIAFRCVGGYNEDVREPFPLGGSDGLRGYEYHEFHGDYLGLLIVDYEFALVSFHRTLTNWPIARLDHLALHCFTDAGDVWRQDNGMELKSSIGAGATLYFYLLVKAPYSVGLELAQSLTDSGNEPVIQITFGSLL